MKLTYIICPIIILLFSSCEKEIQLTGEETEPQVVVNSMAMKDSIWKVNLSESRSLLSNDALPPIENASIRLLNESGTNLGTFTYESFGNYTLSSPLPEYDRLYELVVTAPGFEVVSAKSSIPKPIEIINVDTVFSPADYNMDFDIKFQDEKNVKNYYSLQIITGSYWIDFESEDTIYYENYGFITSEPYVVNGYSDALSPNEKYANEFYFSDDLFDGSLVSFNAKAYYIDPITGGFYRIILTSLSEEAYKYFVTLDRCYQANGDFFAEPVQVISNIENGLGIFGGKSRFERVLLIE